MSIINKPAPIITSYKLKSNSKSKKYKQSITPIDFNKLPTRIKTLYQSTETQPSCTMKQYTARENNQLLGFIYTGVLARSYGNSAPYPLYPGLFTTEEELNEIKGKYYSTLPKSILASEFDKFVSRHTKSRAYDIINNNLYVLQTITFDCNTPPMMYKLIDSANEGRVVFYDDYNTNDTKVVDLGRIVKKPELDIVAANTNNRQNILDPVILRTIKMFSPTNPIYYYYLINTILDINWYNSLPDKIRELYAKI